MTETQTFKLRTGQEILLDSTDFFKVTANPWIQTPESQVILLRPLITLGHFILGVNPKAKIEHKNGNELDFRKENLKVIG